MTSKALKDQIESDKSVLVIFNLHHGDHYMVAHHPALLNDFFKAFVEFVMESELFPNKETLEESPYTLEEIEMMPNLFKHQKDTLKEACLDVERKNKWRILHNANLDEFYKYHADKAWQRAFDQLLTFPGISGDIRFETVSVY